jgi:hypothetical protein
MVRCVSRWLLEAKIICLRGLPFAELRTGLMVRRTWAMCNVRSIKRGCAVQTRGPSSHAEPGWSSPNLNPSLALRRLWRQIAVWDCSRGFSAPNLNKAQHRKSHDRLLHPRALIGCAVGLFDFCGLVMGLARYLSSIVIPSI